MGVRDRSRLEANSKCGPSRALFDRKRAVLNRKTIGPGPGDAVQRDVAWIAVGHHQMHSQSALGGARAPDVQIVQIRHAEP